MKRLSAVILMLVVLVGASVSQAQWKMRVHRSGQVDEYLLSEVDSLTFYQDSVATVLVAAGVFTMGDGSGLCGKDELEVTLTRDFYLGKHEVTNQEYMVALQWAYDNGYVTATTASVQDNLDGSTEELLDLDSWWCEIQFDGAETFYLRESPADSAQIAYPSGYDPASHPVQKVSWYGAARYCDWLSMQAGLPRAYQHTGDWLCNGGDPYGAVGYRLPTDAEWEYAAQYNDDRIYPWGNQAPTCDLANCFRDSASAQMLAQSAQMSALGEGHAHCVGWTTPVGSYPSAPAALGLSDMTGNAWEWCNDWHVCDLGTAPVTDPVGPATGTRHVLHGGSWHSDATHTRSASRLDFSPRGSVGFRVARTVSP